MQITGNTVYGFFYNDFIYESADALVSLHVTPEGAQKALESHKQEQLQEWKSRMEAEKKRWETDPHIKSLYTKQKWQKHCDSWKFGEHKSWQVFPLKIQDN